jgi:hypothetical protein
MRKSEGGRGQSQTSGRLCRTVHEGSLAVPELARTAPVRERAFLFEATIADDPSNVMLAWQLRITDSDGQWYLAASEMTDSPEGYREIRKHLLEVALTTLSCL